MKNGPLQANPNSMNASQNPMNQSQNPMNPNQNIQQQQVQNPLLNLGNMNKRSSGSGRKAKKGGRENES